MSDVSLSSHATAIRDITSAAATVLPDMAHLSSSTQGHPGSVGSASAHVGALHSGISQTFKRSDHISSCRLHGYRRSTWHASLVTPRFAYQSAASGKRALDSLTCRSSAFDQPSGPSQSNVLQQAAASVRQFVQAQFLPLALSSALLLGCAAPKLGVAAANLNVPLVSTFGIFIVQGLSLKRGEAVKAMKSAG